MENRNGLIVDVQITHANGTAEREAALEMLKRRGDKHKRATVGADKGYDSKAFIKGCRKLKVTPHVAAKDKHSAVDARATRHEGYETGQKVRKRIEEAFGWIKTVGGLANTKLIGQAELTGQALLCHLQPGAHWQHQRLVGCASCLSPGIRAPEMGETACKKARLAVAIAALARLGGSFLRNHRPWCVRKPLFNGLLNYS